MPHRIVFLQPRTYAKAYYKNGHGCEQRWIPWFALLLGPIVRAHGLLPELVDCRTQPDWDAKIKALKPGDLLAVSVITGHAIRDAIIASEIARAAQVKVVWGGPHASLFCDETLAEAPVDAVVRGTGYLPMQSIAKAVATERWPPGKVVGLTTREDGPHPDYRTGCAIVPEPDFTLVDEWQHYINSDTALAPRTINYVASEGCARRCTFCSEPAISDKSWSPHDVFQSMKAVRELCNRSNANGLKFHDANFFHDKHRAMAFAERIGEELGIPWGATIHPADLVALSRDDLFRLARSGLSRILVGLESPCPEITRLAGKQYDPNTATKLAKRLAEAGIRGMFTYIVGWPGAPPSHYAQTIAAAKQMCSIWNEHQAKIHFLEPWPGTPIFRLLMRHGFSPPRRLSEWANIDYYHAKHAEIHDATQVAAIQEANKRLSPYVDA